MVADPKMQFSAGVITGSLQLFHIFAGEITGSLFQVNILVAHMGVREGSRASKQTGVGPHCRSLLFLLTLGFEGTSFSWI